MNSNIVIPQGVDTKQLDQMMKGQGTTTIPIQVPKEIQEAQKQYVEDGKDIYIELAAIESDNVIAKALRWMMKSQLPYEVVSRIDKSISQLQEDNNE